MILDLSVLPHRPGPLAIERFITRSLLVSLEEVLTVQFSTSSFVYIQCISSEVANKLIGKNLKHTIKCGKEEIPIPVLVNEEHKEVRVHDLPLDIADDAILNVMKQYGTVLSITSERWKKFFGGVPNGVKLLRMKLDQPIPKRLKIDGSACTVIHKGQSNRLNYNNSSKSTQQKQNNKNKTTNNNQNKKKTGTSTNSVPSSSVKNSNNNSSKQNNYNGNSNNEDNNSKVQSIGKQNNISNDFNNISNEDGLPKEPEKCSNEDKDGFQVVLSKSDWRNRKRAPVENQREEDSPKPKRSEMARDILKEVIKKNEDYYKKWVAAGENCDSEAEEEYFTKWDKYVMMEIEIQDTSAKRNSETVQNKFEK